MLVKSLHKEIMQQFKRNLISALEDVENGKPETKRFYFSDFCSTDDGQYFHAWEKEEDAKLTVRGYYEEFVNDEGNTAIYVGDIPTSLCLPYIEGLSEDEMEMLATVRGKAFYSPNGKVWKMPYQFDEDFRIAVRKLFISDEEVIPFYPCIVLKREEFIENN